MRLDASRQGRIRASLSRLSSSSLIRNAIFAYSAQGFRLVSPLLLALVLARRLGPTAFGQVLVAQSIAAYVALLIDFGLHLSSVRRIAGSNSEDERRQAVSEAGTARMVTAVIFTITVLPALHLLGAHMQLSTPLLIASWLYGMAQASIPHWYFQGVQRMKTSALSDLTGQLIALTLILFVVNRTNGSVLVISLQALGALGAGIFASTAMIRELQPRFAAPAAVVRTLREAFPLFVTRGSIALYTLATPILLTFHTSPGQAAYYMAADKIVTGLGNFYAPIAQFFMPHLSSKLSTDRSGALRDFRMLTTIAIGGGAIVAAILSLFAAQIYPLLFGAAFAPAVAPARIIAWLIPLGGLSQLLAFSLLVPLRREWSVNGILATAGLVTVGMAGLATSWGGLVGFAALRTTVEASIAITLFIVLWKSTTAKPT